jgi:hypothetical protein
MSGGEEGYSGIFDIFGNPIPARRRPEEEEEYEEDEDLDEDLGEEEEEEEEEPYNGIMPANVIITAYFTELMNTGSPEEIALFLNNLERNFLSNKMFRHDNNALIKALFDKNYDIALLLLNRKTVDVNVADANGMTPLFHCVNIKDYEPTPEDEVMIFEIVEKLLAAGCNPGHVDKNGHTALIFACKSASDLDIKIATKLLDYDNCNLTKLDNENATGLDWLLTFTKDYPIQGFISAPGYVDLVVKYFDAFIKLKGLDDEEITRILKDICRRNKRSLLRKTFGPKLSKLGINLNNYCKQPRVTIAEVAGLTDAEYVERDPASLALIHPDELEADQIQEAVKVRPRGVSPGGRWVEDESLYRRLTPRRTSQSLGGKKTRQNKKKQRKTRKHKRANKKSRKFNKH